MTKYEMLDDHIETVEDVILEIAGGDMEDGERDELTDRLSELHAYLYMLQNEVAG